MSTLSIDPAVVFEALSCRHRSTRYLVLAGAVLASVPAVRWLARPAPVAVRYPLGQVRTVRPGSACR